MRYYDAGVRTRQTWYQVFVHMELNGMCLHPKNRDHPSKKESASRKGTRFCNMRGCQWESANTTILPRQMYVYFLAG